jgi:diacylglycerol kinase
MCDLSAEVFMTRLVQPPHDHVREPGAGPKPRPSWRAKFGFAFRGIKLGIRGHSSFFVHFFFAALTVAAAFALDCDMLEWCALVGCIGFVLTAELFNSAIETMFRGLDEATRQRVWPCLDIAAGAVLLASIVAVVIGMIIFLPKLAALVL